MTAQEAYVNGFCKTAAAHGVDPFKLVKRAFSLGEIISVVKKPLSRYGELMAGGNKAVLKNYNKTHEGILKIMNKGIAKQDPRLYQRGRKSLDAFIDARLGVKNRYSKLFTNKVRRELRNVGLARTGTATGVGLGGYGAYSMMSDDDTEKTAADSSRGNAVSEVAGHLTAPMALALLTGNPRLGAAAAGFGNSAGGIAALLTKKRSRSSQSSHDSSSHVLQNLLVPGMGGYNMWKRIGSSTKD